MDLIKSSLIQIAEQVKSKKISACEVSTFFLERARRLNPELNAYITLNDSVLLEAELVDQKIARGEEVGLLAGVPFGIKDLLCTKGIRTTAASKILGNFIPPYDSTVVARLKKAGAVILGKLNLDEFAMGSSNETSAYGPVKNPWNLAHVPGGSSGGSAAAQSARMAAATIGTDTGGSIRQPSNFCGIVGVKPTYGRVSRYGIVAYASSLDQAGPMVSTVEDAALVLEVICGRDEKDSTTSERRVPTFTKSLSPDVKGMKIGIVKEYLTTQGVDAEILETTQKAADALKKLGAELVEVSIPLTAYAVPIYYLISASEASSNLARYDGVKYGYRAEFETLGSIDLEEFYSKTRGEGFGKEVKRRIMLGTYCLSSGYFDAYYNKACQVRRLLAAQFSEAFKKCDVLLAPTSTHAAFRIGEKITDPLAMYLNDIFTVSTNLAGLPGMSVPFGVTRLGLPIGVQLTGAQFDEQKMLNVGLALETVSTTKDRRPQGV